MVMVVVVVVVVVVVQSRGSTPVPVRLNMVVVVVVLLLLLLLLLLLSLGSTPVQTRYTCGTCTVGRTLSWLLHPLRQPTPSGKLPPVLPIAGTLQQFPRGLTFEGLRAERRRNLAFVAYRIVSTIHV